MKNCLNINLIDDGLSKKPHTKIIYCKVIEPPSSKKI